MGGLDVKIAIIAVFMRPSCQYRKKTEAKSGSSAGFWFRLRLCGWFTLWFRFWFRFCLGIQIIGRRHQWGRQIRGTRNLQISGEHHISKVNSEPTAPDGEPLEVRNLHAFGKNECDSLI